MADKELTEENNKNPEQTHLADSKKSSSNSAGDQNRNFATVAESKYLATAMGAFRQNLGGAAGSGGDSERAGGQGDNDDKDGH